VKVWKKITQANEHWKQARVVILMSYRLQTKNRRHKEGHSKLIKKIIHQEETTTVNLYSPNEYKVYPTSWNNSSTTGVQSTDRSQHNNSGRLQYPTITNR
jgi:hypothetical protein